MVRKYVKHIALLLCALFSVVHVDARVFEEGEKLYFNGTPPSFNTWKNDAELWVQLKNGGSDYWLPAQWKGDLPYIEITSDCVGDWTQVVLARCKPGSGTGYIYNQTGDITLHSYLNYIYDFAKGDGWKGADWGTYIPAPDGDPSTWPLKYEDMEICTSAAGHSYELTPKNREYSDKTQNSSWFEYNGSSWNYIQGNNEWTQPGERNFRITLGAEGYDKYFFFQCSTPSKCRLIRIRLNQNCSPGAPGACKITSFIGVASEANVTDSTCAIDGLVAFDDKVNAGDLMVWCEYVDTVTFANSVIETPQTFKLIGFDAKTTKTYTLHTKFLNGNSECEDVCYVTVSPPKAPIVKHDTTILFTKEEVTLTPNNQSTAFFQWTNSINDDKFDDIRNHTFPGQEEEMVMEYVFMATNDPPAQEGNLISNGSFEDKNKDSYLESDYDAWGRNNSEYYSSHEGASGGYAITDNAQTFWHDYQNVSAHEGSYFGLFDSKIYDASIGDQAAWIARSGSKNPDLKVQAGVSYLFSFWVANINTYDQMDNGACLQFQISYDGGTSWTKLGAELNLNNFKDHNWHGRSSIATPDVTSDNVVISVINLNHSDQNIGNDFALDDIRFEAVTSHSSNIAAYERFPVKYIECEIFNATFEQEQSACGVTEADVNYTITFKHPRGDLYIFEKVGEKLTKLAQIPNSEIGDRITTTSYTGVLKDQPVDNKTHEIIVYFEDALVKTEAPQSYSYDSHAVPAISVKSISWDSESVTCDNPTVTLTAVVNYTNQNGKLTANVDGHAADPAPTYTSVESDTEDQVTLIFPGIAADGRTDHKLNVNFDGSKGCSISDYAITEAAPYMPNITSTKAEIQQYACVDVNYQVTITVTYENPQDHDLIITDEAGHEKVLKATEAEYGTTSASWIFDMPWDDPEPKEHTFKAYFEGADGCKDKPTHLCKYTAPAKPSISAIGSYIDLDCEKTTYTLQLDLTYTNQKGTKFYASVDGGDKVEVTNPNPGAQTEKKDVTLKVTGLLADGKTDHTYRVWTDNTEDCELDITYKAPFAPVISNISATPKQMGCDETEYDVTVTFDVTNGQDSMVTVWCKADKYTSVKAIEGTNTITFEKVKTDAEKDYVDIWFAGAVNCKDKHHVEYTEPVTPKISITQGPEVGDMECDKTTYTVKFDIAYINQRGHLFAWIDEDDAHKKEFPYKENQPTEDKVTIPLQELPGDGLEHTIHVQFDGENSCSIEIKSFKAPFTPVISDVQIKRSEMKCGEKTFQVTVEATLSENAKGHKLTVTGDTGKDGPITYDITDTKFSEVFTLDRDKATGKFLIYFEDADNCEPQDSTYDPPKVPGLSVDPVEIPVPKCDQTTFDLTISGSYTYLRGTELHFLWDGVEKAKQTITSLSDVEIVSATLKDLAYDGQKHVLTVQSNETTYDICPVEQKDIEVPSSPDIKSTVAKVLPYVCDAPNYQVTITVTYENPQGHDLIITDEAGHEKTLKATDAEYGETSASWTFDMPWENPVVGHTFKAYFEGAEGCKDEDSHKDSYIAFEQPKLTGDTTALYCNNSSFKWHGTDYTTADMPITYAYKSKVYPECDSIVTLTLTELSALTGDTTATITKGSYFKWHGVDYNAANTPATFTYTSKVAPYCDSIVTLTVNEIEALVGDTFATFCHGTSFTWYGTEYFTSGTPTHTLKSKVDTERDSVVILHLTELDLITGDTTAYYCYGLSFKWHGVDYTTADMPITYTCKSKVHTDCDSIVTLKLIERPLLAEDTIAYYCQGHPFEWYGNSYTADVTPPTHTFTSKQYPECDSIVTLRLTELPTLHGDTTATITKGSYFTWHGVDYNSTNTPTHTYTSKVTGCDSIVTLTINEIEALVGDTFATFCHGSSFTWYGTEYFSSGTPTHTLKSKVQPEQDSIVTLHLTELDLITGDTTAYYCSGGSFKWHGTDYTTADMPITYTCKSKVHSDCDSIVTLTLIERPLLAEDTVAYYCQGYAFEWYGNSYTADDTPPTHTFTSKQFPECDSIVTLRLTELPTLTGDTTATITKGSYFKWHGVDYNATNTPTHTYTSKVTGCDSIVTLTINEIDALVGDTFATFCHGTSFTWYGIEYFTSGTPTHTLKSKIQIERDSVVILHLTELDLITGDTIAYYSDGSSFKWHGIDYTINDPAPTHTYTSKVTGCDSIVTLHLKLLSSSEDCYSTEGTEFFVAFMPNGGIDSEELELFATSRYDATMTISNPRMGWSSNISIPANGTNRIIIPNNYGYTSETEFEQVLDKGLIITSTSPISLFASNSLKLSHKDWDAANILPLSVLSSRYIVQTIAPTNPGRSEFAILATEDGTTIDIGLTAKTSGGHKVGKPYQISLNRGQVYMCYGENENADFSGTTIDSHGKKVAVFNGVNQTCIPFDKKAADHLYEQAIPIERLGKKFAITSTRERQRDKVKITAVSNSTEIYVDGIKVSTINAKQSYEFLLETPKTSCYVETSNPVVCNLFLMSHSVNNQFRSNMGDPAMVAVYPIEQTTDFITFATVSTAQVCEHYVNIITRTDNISEIYLDGKNISSSFSLLSGNNTYSFARLTINEGSHTISSLGTGFLGHVYGLAHVESYAYNLGTTLCEQIDYHLDGDTTKLTICEGDDFEWNGLTPTSTGLYDVYLTSQVTGFDSLCVLDLTVNPILTSDTTAYYCNGSSFKWHGIDYTINDPVPTHTYTSKVTGCDSIVTLILIERPSLAEDTIAYYCHGTSFEWYGNNYTADITPPTHTFTSKQFPECDSIVTLRLTELPTLIGDTTATITKGSSFTWHGVNYTEANTPATFTYTSKVAPYCDSIVTLTINEIDALVGDTFATFCNGSSFIWYGTEYFTSGTPTHTLKSKVDTERDSVVILHLTELDLITGDTTAYYCNGSSFKWHGIDYKATDPAPTHTYTSKVAPYCDSIVTLTLIERPLLAEDTVAYYCQGYAFEWYGNSYTADDTPPTHTFTSKQFPECDSIVTLRLTELPTLTGDTTATITKGSYFKWHGVDYNATNTPTHTYTSKVTGCDSIVTLTINEIDALVGDTFATFCNGSSFIWYGTEYFTSGTPTHTLKSKVDTERDSVVILHLTELAPIIGDTTAYYCQGYPFEWYGNTYTINDPAPTHTFTSKQFPECDSIVSLQLIELPTLHGDTTATITKGSYFKWHGVDYNATNTPTHTYTSKVTGCDSIVTLTINEIDALVGDTFATFCKGSSFTWYGTEYFTSGTHTHTLKSKVDTERDSVVILHLAELQPTDSIEVATISAGETYTWHGQTFTESTEKKEILTNAVGCDSVCTLILTVLPTTTEIVKIQPAITPTTDCDGTTYDLSVTFEYINLNGTLSVDLDGTTADNITPIVPDSDIPQTATATFSGLTADGLTHTLTIKTIGSTHYCEASINVDAPQNDKIHLTATASVMPYACGDHTYSVNVEVEFANGQGRDLIFEDWKGNIEQLSTNLADTKKEHIFEYQKYTPGGKHGFKVYFDGYEDCAVYAYYIEPAQPKIDIIDYTATTVTRCDGTTYHLTVKFEYTNQDGTLSVDLDGRPADNITPDFVPDVFDNQPATATFYELTADGQKHTLTVQTTGGVHNCLKSVTVDAPQAEDIITSVEVTDVPENIRCDHTEYDVTVTVTMSSDNAIGKKIIIAHEGQTDDFIATANPMETTVRMTTADAAGLTVDAYFDGHPECKVTSKTFDAPQRLKCIKDYAQTCEGERYTWSVTGLTYGPFAKAGTDTIVNEFNMLDTLIVTVYPTYNMPEEHVTIIDGETYTWNGKDYETEGIYKETLLSEHDCDSIVTLNLTVKENIVEEVAFTIAEQCAGEGLLEIAVQHTGLLTDARLTFSPEAVAAGFVNDTYPLDDQDIVSVPYNVKAGIFSVHIDLLFHSRLKHSADEPFTLLFPRTVLEQGWMDAIFVLTHDYNGGYDFTDFQWYKKGQMLVGETGPYLYQPLEVGAEYSAMLTEASGLKLMTCPLIVTEHSEISLYPTVVTRKDLIHVNVSQDARLTLYSIMGERHNSYSLLSGDTRINAPGTQGIYLAEIVLESGQRKVFKIMVR